MNKNKNTAYLNLWDAAINTYIRKEKKDQINHFTPQGTRGRGRNQNQSSQKERNNKDYNIN